MEISPSHLGVHPSNRRGAARQETGAIGKPLVVLLVVVLSYTVVVAIQAAPDRTILTPQAQAQQWQWKGHTAWWWAKRARANRINSDLRGATIVRLKRTIAHRPDIREAVALATIAYPALTQHRAWCIIRHESWMTRHPLYAKNPNSSATGLYQFLTSTFASTPYGKAGFSIYSAYAQSLAAGWMHENNRGGEWAIRC